MKAVDLVSTVRFTSLVYVSPNLFLLLFLNPRKPSYIVLSFSSYILMKKKPVKL